MATQTKSPNEAKIAKEKLKTLAPEPENINNVPPETLVQWVDPLNGITYRKYKGKVYRASIDYNTGQIQWVESPVMSPFGDFSFSFTASYTNFKK